MPSHIMSNASILMSLPNAKHQQRHRDWSSGVLEGLDEFNLPFSIFLPLNGVCVLNLYDDHMQPARSMQVPFGSFCQFRGDITHAGGPNTSKCYQFRIHCYFTTVNTPYPEDEVYVFP